MPVKNAEAGQKASIKYVPAPDLPAEARPASTVILIREAGNGIETYLMQRKGRQGAFAGAFVFPGGVMEPSDAGFGPGEDGALDEAEPSNALFMAAIRETFEEAGILFADGAHLVPSGLRAELAAGRTSLWDIAREYGLTFRPDELLSYSRWITPLPEPRRFDARFFAARLPEGQEPIPDGSELDKGLWISPSKAVAGQAAGDMVLFPPTLCTLWELAKYGSWEALALDAAARSQRPVLPQPFYTDDSMGVLLPNDPDYGIEGFRREARPGEPSRVVAVRNCWELL